LFLLLQKETAQACPRVIGEIDGVPCALANAPALAKEVFEMSMRLDGKITIVTGGLSGIGEAIARRMVNEGAVVIAVDVTSKETTLGSGALLQLGVDVRDPVSVEAIIRTVVSRFGRLDCVVNSAGIGKDIPFLETTLETFDRIIDVNLRGSFVVGQAAARAMTKTGGSIVNVASVSGIRGNAGRAAYGASKAGVILLSQVMAIDLASSGIRVNVLAPGPVETPLVSQMHSEKQRGGWVDHTPLHRYAHPDEIAGAAVFLCSDDASFVTGHVMVVDGGFLAVGLTAPSKGEQEARANAGIPSAAAGTTSGS
jgi:NAD(P)-dependent dehydrogenase (short-subunit alcohol dehydrogenase family)